MSNPFEDDVAMPPNPFDLADPASRRRLIDGAAGNMLAGMATLAGRANGKATVLLEAAPVQVEEPAAVAPATIAPVTNRAESLRVIAMCEAVAKALREQLAGEARDEYEGNGTRAVWDVPGVGKVVTSIDQPGVIVSDREAWMGYARKRWPDEIVMTPAFRNPAFEKVAREAFEKLFAGVEAAEEFMTARTNGIVLDDEGSAVPGLRWVEGGAFRSASLTVDPKLKRQVADRAREFIAGTGPLEIEGVR